MDNEVPTLKDLVVEYLKAQGWSTWYHPNYWVHKKTIKDSSRQDHTNYGLPLEAAFEFETKGLEPFDPILLGDMMGSGGRRQFLKRKRAHERSSDS